MITKQDFPEIGLMIHSSFLNVLKLVPNVTWSKCVPYAISSSNVPNFILFKSYTEQLLTLQEEKEISQNESKQMKGIQRSTSFGFFVFSLSLSILKQ